LRLHMGRTVLRQAHWLTCYTERYREDTEMRKEKLSEAPVSPMCLSV